MGIENRHQLKLLDDIPMENKANPCAETNWITFEVCVFVLDVL
jgi:hypothetical protein